MNKDQVTKDAEATNQPQVASPEPEVETEKAHVPAISVSVPAQQQPVPLEALDAAPQLIDCPFCRHVGVSRVVEEHSDQTQKTAVLCCLCVGVLGVWVPYALRWYQDYHHHCSHCGVKVALSPNKGPVQVFRPQILPGGEYVSPPAPAPAKVSS